MTSGRMEGINRKIRTMLRQFYGLRDNDFLRLKLYALRQSKHKLVGGDPVFGQVPEANKVVGHTG